MASWVPWNQLIFKNWKKGTHHHHFCPNTRNPSINIADKVPDKYYYENISKVQSSIFILTRKTFLNNMVNLIYLPGHLQWYNAFQLEPTFFDFMK